jgi:Flp pilus assembly protein protease CpaA
VRLFFPDVAYAWIFCATLVLLTSIAAYIDTKKAIVPNRLNVLILALGIVANVVRGAWLAAEGRPVWWLWEYNPGATWLGAIDALLFAIVGFLLAFGAMFVMWIFGVCGGGDVKLLGAMGGWIGPEKTLFFVWFVSVVVLMVWVAGRVVLQVGNPRNMNRTLGALKSNGSKADGGKPRAHLRVTYSMPLAIATALVLLWVFRFELQLAAPKPQPQPAGISYARPQPDPV